MAANGKKDRYPLEMHHPHFRKGEIVEVMQTKLDGKELQGEAYKSYRGTPDLFPPMIVRDADTEAFYRAKGYLAKGEAMPAAAHYSEYPVMLSHPDHVDAVPEKVEQVRNNEGHPVVLTIPGKPEKFPPKQANNKAEEAALIKQGYKRLGASDPLASERATACPYDAKFKPEEYPKMVDGKIVDPLNTVQHNRYPMYVGDVLVNNAEEEKVARKNQPETILPAERCIICGEPFKSADEWQNGAAGPFHASHLGKAPQTDAATKDKETTGAPEKTKSQKRIEAGKKAAETRKAKKERERQAAMGE